MILDSGSVISLRGRLRRERVTSIPGRPRLVDPLVASSWALASSSALERFGLQRLLGFTDRGQPLLTSLKFLRELVAA